jgi:hypothetical protein
LFEKIPSTEGIFFAVSHYLCPVKKLLLSISFLCITAFLLAQPTLDTIAICLDKKPTLFARIDTRNSFIENSRAKIIGFKAGLNYNKRLFFGAGYNQLFGDNPAFNKEVYYTNTANEKDSTTARLRMYYISIHAEYIFYQAGKWRLSMPLQFGIGKTYYKYFLFDKKMVREENSNLIYEPGISVEYKILKWAGVGADIGYRFLITDDKKLSNGFTSPTYAFKFLIYYAELYKSLFPNSKWASKL